MQFYDCRKGMLITNRAGDFWGEIVDLSTRGTVIYLAYSDGHRHYAQAREFVPLPIAVVPDGKEFYGYVPDVPRLDGINVFGRTFEGAHYNLRYAVYAYVMSMVKHGEIPKRPATLGRRDV